MNGIKNLNDVLSRKLNDRLGFQLKVYILLSKLLSLDSAKKLTLYSTQTQTIEYGSVLSTAYFVITEIHVAFPEQKFSVKNVCSSQSTRGDRKCWCSKDGCSVSQKFDYFQFNAVAGIQTDQ